MKHSVATDLPVLITNLDGSTLEWFLNVLCRHFVYIPYTAASPFNHFCVDKPYSVSSGEADLVPAPVFVDQLHLSFKCLDGGSIQTIWVLCSVQHIWLDQLLAKCTKKSTSGRRGHIYTRYNWTSEFVQD